MVYVTWTTYSGYNRFPYLEEEIVLILPHSAYGRWNSNDMGWYCYNTDYGYEFTYSWSVVLEQRKYLKNTIVKKTSTIKAGVSKNDIKNYIKNNNLK